MSNWKLYGSVAAASLAAVAVALPAQAQVTTSTIRGAVTTQAGEPVAGATAIITHTPSGTVSTAFTNESGVFSARNLRVGGPYTVEISGGEFTPVEISDIYVALDETFPLNITVQGARTLETVVVTASQTQVGFLNDGLSTSLGLEALNEVTSIDRDITDAAQLDPFASVNVQSGGAKELTIAGANNRFNSLTIDGVPLNDRFGLNANGYPTQRSPISYDAIESLSIQTAPFDVEFNGFTGGTINAVTKSGTNEFHGSIAYYMTDDSLIGDKNQDDDFDFTFEEETIVATLGGPIIKDKLFFFVAYDKYEEVAPLQDGPAGSGALDTVDSISFDQVDEVGQIVSDTWGFDIGGFDKAPAEDEKILANIDWNINNNHRAKFTYILTEGNTIREQNGNNFLTSGDRLGTSSAWYDRSEKVESFIGHVFSDWTPNFSTQLKISSTTQATGQNSLNGAEFPSFGIRLNDEDNFYNVAEDFEVDPNGDDAYLVTGPDRFRHGNELDQEFLQIKAAAEYVVGDHVLKFGFEREEVDVDNLFAQNSEGSYAFDPVFDDTGALVTTGLEGLESATATGLLYNNAVTNDENDLRAIWGYNFNSLYFQDTWAFSPTIEVQAGLRYDWYESEGEIRENENFRERYGYTNTADIDGLDVILPRLSIKWTPTDDLTFRGGIGRFSGGSPGVWISNSYSNDGVISDSSNAFGSVAVPTEPDPATGQYIPADVLDALATEEPDGSVNALGQDFDIPTTWKLSAGVAYNTDVPYLGEDWLFSADFLYNKLENASYWYNQNCEDPVAIAPDGRGVYDCGGAPEALIVDSVDKGHSMLFAVSASKDWETIVGDFDLFTSYTYADVEDIGYGTSSTATSNYSDSARYDLQQPRTGTSNFQTEHLFKLRANWEKKFFGDYATKASIFAERRSGQPYSYTFSENNACVFDVGGGRCARESRVDDAGHLLYVPSGPNDPLFSPTSFGGDLDAQQAFFDYINNSELSQYAGGIAERNGDNSRWSTIVDLRLQQEFPGILEDHRTFFFLDIENLGNLLNDEWGRIERTEYEYERDVVSARIVDGQYEYFNLQDPDRIENLEVLEQSVWQIQLGVKYQF